MRKSTVVVEPMECEKKEEQENELLGTLRNMTFLNNIPLLGRDTTIFINVCVESGSIDREKVLTALDESIKKCGYTCYLKNISRRGDKIDYGRSPHCLAYALRHDVLRDCSINTMRFESGDTTESLLVQYPISPESVLEYLLQQGAKYFREDFGVGEGAVASS